MSRLWRGCVGWCLVAWTAVCGADTLVLAEGHDPTQWRGADAEPVADDDGMVVRWRAGETHALELPVSTTDWSAYNALSLRIRATRKDNCRYAVLFLESGNASVERSDYYSMVIRLNFDGWRDIFLPFYELARVGNPDGWSSITRLVLETKSGEWHVPGPDTVIDVGQVRLSDTAPTAGPVLSDEEFFADLDYSRPGLAEVEDAVNQGDYGRAREAFASYFRNRSKPRWFTDWRDRPKEAPAERPDTTKADRYLANQLLWGDRWYELGDDIDWAMNPMSEGESATVEWNCVLNRHFHFRDLGTAYWTTGEAKYAEGVVAQWIDWIEDCPMLFETSGNSPYHHAWETLNAACRTSFCWPTVLAQCLDSQAMTPDAVVTICKSMVEHAHHLQKWPSAAGNWLTSESSAMFSISVVLEEHREAPEWRRVALARLAGQLEREIYPDGVQCELALGYGICVIQAFNNVFALAKLNDLLDDLPPTLTARLENMFNYLAYSVTPDGRAPGLNDSGLEDPTQMMRLATDYFPDREDFRFVATRGKEGLRPELTSVAFPYSGHYVMRSDWSPEANYLLFDAGPFGRAHQHEDKLHFMVYGGGKPLLTEGGWYMYDNSRWRRYVLSTRAHNTVRVDGMGQNRRHPDRCDTTWTLKYPYEPLGNPWVSNAQFDYVQGQYSSGYGPDLLNVTHTRSILFVKPDYWIVFDTLVPGDDAEHAYELLFHFACENVQVHPEGPDITTTDPGPGLAVMPRSDAALSVDIVKGREEEPVQGWAGDPWRPVPTAVVGLRGRGRMEVATVVCPQIEGLAPYVRRVTWAVEQGEGGLLIETRDDFTDRFTWMPGGSPSFLRHDKQENAVAQFVFATDESGNRS